MIRVVWSGIDTWEESFGGDLAGQVIRELEEKKLQAQEDELPAPHEIGKRVFYVEPTGVRPWRYLLKSEDMQLRLCGPAFAPALSGRLRPLGLLRLGHEKLRADLADIAAALDLLPTVVTRLDIAVDFQGWAPTVADMQNVVCSASYRPIYPNLEHPETYYFGKGDLSVRVYNKTKEIEVKHKEWVRGVWSESADFNPSEDVWRFEVQIRRPVLRQLGCEDAATIFAKLPDILGFGLNWCNLRVPSGQNQSRWPEDARWTALRSAQCTGEALQRVRSLNAAIMFSRAAHMLFSYLLSAAAWMNFTDLDSIWDLLRRVIESYIAESGKDFATLVRERQRRQASKR